MGVCGYKLRIIPRWAHPDSFFQIRFPDLSERHPLGVRRSGGHESDRLFVSILGVQSTVDQD